MGDPFEFVHCIKRWFLVLDRVIGIQALLKVAREKLNEEAEKAQKDFEAEEAKVKQALKEENGESVQSYAENAICMKNKWSKLNRLASRANNIQSAHRSDCAEDVGANDQEKVPAMMDRLEQLAQNLEVHSWAIEDLLSSAPTLTTDQEQVNRFLQDIAEEIKSEEDHDQLSQLPKVPSPVDESSKGIGQD
ncbi:charged multivesicular body protein 1a-like [Sorex fumeus]|uniref:charged multivesicular body protein 1a-like n=1 Tax=Sorex fumeus TaxID=62283 RepID=UPI0024AD0649|nr:charged multivesicular body protein 1a-like [Sorex fumeus]